MDVVVLAEEEEEVVADEMVLLKMDGVVVEGRWQWRWWLRRRWWGCWQ